MSWGTWVIAVGAASAAALPASRVAAALGDAEASIASDRVALAAQDRGTTVHGAFTVHELLAGGTTIREYVSPDGRVFGVAWNGLAHPALGPLLGAYAEEYDRAARATPPARGQRSHRVAGPHVVVELWGHMRDRRGRAYVPDLVPEGVDASAIQ